MVLDLYKQRADEAAKATKPEKPREPTLSENLQDKERSQLLGKMLELEGPTGIDLAARMRSPQAGDIKEFEKRNTTFNEKMGAAKDMGEAITAESIVELGKRVPFLKDQLKIMKPEQLAQVFKNQLPLIAIKDVRRFTDIKVAFDTMQSYRDGAYRHLSEQTVKICSDFRLDQTRFVDIMRNPDSNQRVKLLRKEIGSAFSVKNFLTAGLYSRTKARALESGNGALKDSIDQAQKAMQNKMDVIGSALGLSVEQNDEVREAFMREALGEKDLKKPEQSFKEMSSGMRTGKALEDAWKKEKDSATYKALTNDVDRQQHADNWKKAGLDAEEKAAQAEGGFWRQVGLALVKMLFNNTKFEL